MSEYKAVPLGYTAADVAALAESRPPLRDFPTPLVTLSESAVGHNVETMAAWCRSAGVGLAPHGKTTMSRELWQRQLDAGAWGITVATPWQASVALGWGVPRVLLANGLVQPAALRALAPHSGRLVVWADSVRAVEIMAAGLYPAGEPVLLTAGGSAYFDLVAEALAPRRDPTGERGRVVEVLLRSGAYITHDDGYYDAVTPLRRTGDGRFRAAIHGWATVLSRPEPGLVLVDAGKRDFPYDDGLPVPQAVRPLGGGAVLPLEGASVTALNDQHGFVRVPEDAPIAVGDAIRFGLSHPCTTFDKWRALAVVDDDLAADPRVIGLLETAFG